MSRLCPVCRLPMRPTVNGNIPSHMDSINRDVCPADGYPYYITIPSAPTTVWKRSA